MGRWYVAYTIALDNRATFSFLNMELGRRKLFDDPYHSPRLSLDGVIRGNVMQKLREAYLVWSVRGPVLAFDLPCARARKTIIWS